MLRSPGRRGCSHHCRPARSCRRRSRPPRRGQAEQTVAAEMPGKWTQRLSWLNLMLWGGTLMLVLRSPDLRRARPFRPPFLTALETPGAGRPDGARDTRDRWGHDRGRVGRLGAHDRLCRGWRQGQGKSQKRSRRPGDVEQALSRGEPMTSVRVASQSDVPPGTMKAFAVDGSRGAGGQLRRCLLCRQQRLHPHGR